MTDAVRPQVWGGAECSHIQMGDRFADQLAVTGHMGRADDVDRLAELGVSAVRYPVLWGWPGGRRETDWAWAAQRLGRLVDRGIGVIVGLLHHGYGPMGATPLDPDWPSAFARYAGQVARASRTSMHTCPSMSR